MIYHVEEQILCEECIFEHWGFVFVLVKTKECEMEGERQKMKICR